MSGKTKIHSNRVLQNLGEAAAEVQAELKNS